MYPISCKIYLYQKGGSFMSEYPNPIGPYSISRIEGDVLYLSSQLPVNPETGNVSSDFREQCRQAYTNIKGILQENNLDLNAIFKLTIYLNDISQFNHLNEIMLHLFKKPYPTRTVVQVAAFPYDASICIEACAKLL